MDGGKLLWKRSPLLLLVSLFLLYLGFSFWGFELALLVKMILNFRFSRPPPPCFLMCYHHVVLWTKPRTSCRLDEYSYFFQAQPVLVSSKRQHELGWPCINLGPEFCIHILTPRKFILLRLSTL